MFEERKKSVDIVLGENAHDPKIEKKMKYIFE